MHNDQRGEGLIEVMVTMFIATVVIGAMAIATIRGVTNAQFSQSQVQATKYAQEALESIKTVRDRNYLITLSNRGTIPFSELQQDHTACPDPGCYFTLDSTGQNMTQVGANATTALPGDLQRQIILKTSGVSTNKEIVATAIISWTDSSGTHQSNLQTIFGQLR